ncbi:MAG: GAF domain-containing protein [Ardenticatenaceae bacterium]|nr:GAF domain-containing protein [Ardenticatenaceae bacterium]
MDFAQALVILLYLAATMTNIGLAFYSWQRRPAVWIRPFALLNLALAQWNLAQALEISTPLQNGKLFWHNLQYIGITIVPVLFLAFALAYHSQRRWLTKQYLPLFIIPALTCLFVWANPGSLFQTQLSLDTSSLIPTLTFTPGLWYWIHILYSHLLLLISTLLLIQIWLQANSQQNKSIIILLTAIIPWLGSGLSLTHLVTLDLMPLAFTLTGLLVSWGLFRLNLFDLAPMARQVIVDYMRDGVIVLDRHEQIVDANRSTEKIIGRSQTDMLGQPITTIFPALTWIKEHTDKKTIQQELQINTETYELQVSPIHTGDERTGHLLIFHPITERKQVENELLSQKHLLQNLVIIAKATTTTQTLSATLQNILDVAVAINQAEYGSLFVLNNRGEITHSILTQDKKLPIRQQQTINQQVMEKGLFGWVLSRGELALILDTEEDSRWLNLPGRTQKVRSALAVPIIDHRGVVGVLTLTHSEPGHFNEEQATLMQGAADQMALALRNAQLYDAQKRLAEREHILYEVMRAMDERLDEQWITKTAVESVGHFTGWPALAILLTQDNQLTIAAITGHLARLNGEKLDLIGGLNGRVFHTSKTEKLLDCEEDSHDLPPGFRSGVAIPLRQSDQTIGIFGMYSNKPDGFNDNDVQLGESLAEAIALAIENARLHTNIRNYAADLGALIASSRDGIIYIGLDKQVRVINEMALTLLGLNQDPSQWLNQSISHIFAIVHAQIPPMPITSEYFPEKEILALEAEIDLIQKGDEPPSEGELNLPPHTIQWLSLPLLSEGEALGRLLVFRDVTEERLLARMREDLTHMTVHDLRNPLSSQSMALELLAMDTSEETRPFLEILENNNKKMLTLVNNLLDISRLESRQMPLNYSYVPLADLVETALAQQQGLADDKAITLQSQIPDTITTTWIDRDLIERVFQNLIGNAIKFTPRSGLIRITIDTDPNSYGEWLIFYVYNTGEGIPPDLQDRLFDKFTTGTQEGRGSGLGLAFCKMVIESHGGRIWVESTPGRDATFIFTLPAA